MSSFAYWALCFAQGATALCLLAVAVLEIAVICDRNDRRIASIPFRWVLAAGVSIIAIRLSLLLWNGQTLTPQTLTGLLFIALGKLGIMFDNYFAPTHGRVAPHRRRIGDAAEAEEA